jgi:hypothetical protein
MYWTLQNLKDSEKSSKYCTMAQYLAPLIDSEAELPGCYACTRSANYKSAS